MISILLLYFVGKMFFELAHQYKRKPWPYAILGVLVFYGGMILLGIFLEIIMVLVDSTIFLTLNSFVRTLVLIPLGILSAWILYKSLERNWKKKPMTSKNDIIDDL